jgi:glycosyltransferase involved in cell wall biosynthesis
VHICFLCNEYPPARHGGVGSFTQTLARSLVSRGHSASVVGIYAGIRTTVTEDDEGVVVTRLPHTRLPNAGMIVHTIALRRALAAIHHERPIDVIEGPEGALAMLSRRSQSAVRVIRMHGGHHFFSTTLGDRPRFPRSWIERRSFARADAICAVSRFVAERTRSLLHLEDAEIEVLPNPVDTSAFRPDGGAGVEPDSVVFVGTLCEKKGIRQLIAAMPRIVAAVPTATLHVVGPDRPDASGSFRARLERMLTPALAKHVVFHGAVENRRIPDYLARAAVCVYPSHMEACPVAWLEAMAMKKAIVASRTGPGPEVLEDGVSGLLCDPLDPEAIADRVVAVLKDRALRDRLAAAAYDRAASTFSIGAVLERNVSFYRDRVERFRRASGVRRLLVVSHVVHYRHNRRLFAYAPYARELDVWAEMFPQLLVAAPVRETAPPADSEALTHTNIQMKPQLERGGRTVAAKLALVGSVPLLTWRLARAMREADAIHVRCPGNLGLLGAILAPLFSKHLVAKYAGQWNGYPGEALTTRLQRWVLGSAWWRGVVLVYGAAPGQRGNIVPFFTSALRAQQLVRARASATARGAAPSPLRILYVGRLTLAKNVQVLVEAMAMMTGRGVAARCAIVGDGPERLALDARVTRHGLENRVELVGGVPFESVLAHYERADVLVLASETEGWPKAIAEAMAFGVVCIGSNRGLMPWMLADGRGIVVPPGDAPALADALIDIARDPASYRAMAARAAEWGQRHSLDSFKQALGDLLAARWGLAAARHDAVVTETV